ncbi:MAG: SAM-dependent methyltransferase [Dehalococcoidia bacterium]
MPDYARIYAQQEYLTPGAADTVALLAEAARPAASSRLLEVACGKGEAACTLAGQTGCRVLAVDLFVPFLAHTARKAAERGLDALVTPVRADGRQLPAADERFDAAYCIGAPSIVGLEPGLRELRRAVRPGGVVAVSDVVWRQKPAGPLGPEWTWVAQQQPQVDADEYAAVIAACGLTVEGVHIHPRSAWDDYHRPMAAVAVDARARGDGAFADEVEADLALEQRALDAFWEYATFIARRP